MTPKIYVHRCGLGVARVGSTPDGDAIWRTAPRASVHQWAEFVLEPDASMRLVFQVAFLALRGTG
jgi:hypothetical protein